MDHSSDSCSLLQAAALRIKRLNDVSTLEELIYFVPEESIIREHQKRLPLPSTLLLLSSLGQQAEKLCEMMLHKFGNRILLEARDVQGASALHIAAKTKNAPLLKLFLNKFDAEPLLTSLSLVKEISVISCS